MGNNTGGRNKGRRNKGYFFRNGRGWYTTEGKRMIPLRYEDGEHIKEPKANERDLKEAHARHILDRQKESEIQNETTVLDVCISYLNYAKANGAEKTHFDRADTLFDFCFGLPPEFRNKEGSAPKRMTPELKKEMGEKRFHKGYGKMPVRELTWAGIDEWLASHKNWNGGCRTRVQAVKRALNFGVERKMIDDNPTKGYRLQKSNSRVTYITPEQEKEMYKHGNPTLVAAIKVCIRTGARFGSEFAKLEKRHVVDHGDKMEWVFKAGEIKNKRKRVIRINDSEIIQIIRDHMRSDGPLFRNATGTPWERRVLSNRFRVLKKKLANLGTVLDKDCCMYSTRHTFAKRALQGYWTGRPTNIETLARLLGNTPQVCRDHYLQWSEIDNDPLWDAI
jgi:integrase